MNKKTVIRIVVPVCILIVIAGIWVFKQTDNAIENTDTSQVNEDFALQTNAIDLETLTQYGLPIIIDFGADSCEPCKKMAPVLVKLNDEMQGKAIIKFVDVWQNQEAAKDFPVQVIPTQIFIEADGSPYVPSEDLGIAMTLYRFKETEEHAFTVHQGGLTEEQLRTILKDMGAGQ